MMEGLKGEIMEVLKNFVTDKTPTWKWKWSLWNSRWGHKEGESRMEKLQLWFEINHVPKIDMRNFDGKDPITWILQMEQFFEWIASLYLEPNQFVWYRWLCSRKSLVTWTIFTEEMIAHYEDTRSNIFFIQLINLKKNG